jgi:uncharacterized damage-inducible protein DinB
MEKATTQLANRFREVILNGTWIANTNLKDQLSDLTVEQATIKVGTLNTIATLTFHLHYYIAGILQVLEGGSLDIRDKYSFDHPPYESQADWENLLTQLWHDAEKFAALVEKMPQNRFKKPFFDDKYGDYLRNIDGMIEHSYYHLGQIVLIKKMILGKKEG